MGTDGSVSALQGPLLKLYLYALISSPPTVISGFVSRVNAAGVSVRTAVTSIISMVQVMVVARLSHCHSSSAFLPLTERVCSPSARADAVMGTETSNSSDQSLPSRLYM